ncbi:Rieske (2Fe-2S) protein [Streptomyces sp. JJ36]|nr:Rieske (2Fe-2S) protein [Streptomyces sp. JJ36]
MTTTRRPGHAARHLLPPREGPGRILQSIDRLEHTASLDAMAFTLRRAVKGLPLGRLRDALHGRGLGHPFHPLSVQIPIGTWTSATILDALPGQRIAARTLIGVGLASAAPAALAGWVDWAELRKPQMRVGLLHAALNVTAVGLYSASLGVRIRGREGRGRALALAGLTTVGLGGALGAHMSFRQAAGANQTEHIATRVGDGWHPLGALTEFPVDQPVRRTVTDVPVVVVRDADDQVYVLADQCSHMAGPLSQGELVDGCLQCPWHGSRFDLATGWNVAGPATAPQPAFETRTAAGQVQARLR